MSSPYLLRRIRCTVTRDSHIRDLGSLAVLTQTAESPKPVSYLAIRSISNLKGSGVSDDLEKGWNTVGACDRGPVIAAALSPLLPGFGARSGKSRVEPCRHGGRPPRPWSDIRSHQRLFRRTRRQHALQ